MRWLRCPLLVSAALAGVLLVPPQAAATRGWLPPVDVGPGSFAQVEESAGGTAVAVWLQAGAVYSAVRTGGTWSAPMPISGGAEMPDRLHLAVDPAGTAVATWHRTSGSNYVVQAAVRPASTGQWQSPQDISGPSNSGVASLGNDVAMNAQGDAIAIWNRYVGSVPHVESAFRPAGGAWQSPQEVSVGWATRIAIDGGGNAYAIWESYSFTILASVRSAATGEWGAAETLSEYGHPYTLAPEVTSSRPET